MQNQEEITSHVRSHLVDFLHKVTNDPFDESSGGQFCLSSNTFHRTVIIIDRYCSKVTTVEINKFRLVGVTAILIASKHNNEPNLPDANDLSAYGCTTWEEILAMEQTMLGVVGNDLDKPIARQFLHSFLRLTQKLRPWRVVLLNITWKDLFKSIIC